MTTENEASELGFSQRLDRRKGRLVRDRMTGVRFTRSEMEECDHAASAAGQLFGEWARDILLREARNPQTDALFTEIVAIRMLLNLVLKPLVCGQLMAPEDFSTVLANVRTTKRKAAADVMEQYATAAPRER